MTQTHPRPDVSPTAHYQSRFLNWERRASVRVKPRRMLDPAEPVGCYFPPELHPVSTHPLVTARGPGVVDRLLVQRLYGYLGFTTELEEVAVMPVAMRLSRGRAGLELPGEMRRDAFKIVTDEAWHAQFSDDLMEQVRQATGVDPLPCGAPQFLWDLEEIGERLEPSLRGANELLFSVVSETLVSAILVDLPRDRRLPRAVREVVADHAEDEGKHHSYFRGLLSVFWPGLGRTERRELGLLVPSLIHAFLQPDYRATARALWDAGLTAEQAAQVIAESHPQEAVVSSIAAASQACVRYFAEVGALDDVQVRDAFAAAGLEP